MELLSYFLDNLWLGKPVWMWLTFVGIVIVLLALDLGVLHRTHRAIGIRESLVLSAGYIALALLYGVWVWWELGAEPGLAYFTGFAIEKALAIDNVFVIAMIFSFFAVPPRYQHRVLFWGILGALIMRAGFIAGGITLMHKFH